MTDPLDDLQAAIGYSFADRALLEAALVHRSHCAEHPDERSNERMEFLGDAVLSLAVTDHAYATYDLPEGDLARVRAWVVSTDVLAEVAAEVGIGPALRLGRGEAAAGGREKRSVLADAMEAVFAGVFLDGGWEPARDLVLRLLAPRFAAGVAGEGGEDHKTLLQELVRRDFDQQPRYQVRAEGPDHAKRFFAMVTIGGAVHGHGEGRSKKAAEQAAARSAYAALVPSPPDGAGAP